MNTITIIGYLTKDPAYAVRDVAGKEMSVCNFTVAVNAKNSAGQERTDYFKVGTWLGTADACAKYLKKGSRVAVHGSVGLDQHTDKGKVYTDLVVFKVKEVEFLDRPTRSTVSTRVGGEEENNAENNTDNNSENVNTNEDNDDDFPW